MTLVTVLGCGASGSDTLEVKVERTLLPAPSIDDSDRKVYMIEYQITGDSTHFIYIPEKEWTKEKEAALIKADMKKRLEITEEIITL